MTSEKKHISRFAKTIALSAFAAGTLCCFGSGCATVFSGIRQDVDIDSQPTGAEVFVNGDFVGRTPLTLELMRDEHPLLVLKKDGFEDTRVRIERGGNGKLAWNLLWGPLFGPFTVALDFRAGTEDSYSETDIVVPLFPDGKKTWLALYGGNVVLENCSPNITEDESLLPEIPEPSAVTTAEQAILRDALQNALSEKLPTLRRRTAPEMIPTARGAQFIHGKDVRVRIRERAKITVSREGKITNYSFVESEAKKDVINAVMKALAAVAETFVVPEDAVSALPVTLIVPVESKQ